MDNEPEKIPIRIEKLFQVENKNLFKLCWINQNNELSYTIEEEENIPIFLLAKFWENFSETRNNISTITDLTPPLNIPKKRPEPYPFFSVGLSIQKSTPKGMIAENAVPIKILQIDFNKNSATVLFADNPKECNCDLQTLLYMYPTILVDFLEKELQKS